MGQGQYREAAHCCVTATQVNAADPRALRLLQDLVKEHPELAYEFGEVGELCQKATEVAAEKAAELKPVVYRGWRKRIVLLRARLHSIFQRFRN